MRVLIQLMLEIETNRQRLQFALEAQNQDLVNRMSILLAQLHSAFFDEVKGKGLVKMNQLKLERRLFVVSEAHQDGVCMSETEYRALAKTMSRADFETHVCVEVSPEIEPQLEQVLLIDASARKGRAS